MTLIPIPFSSYYLSIDPLWILPALLCGTFFFILSRWTDKKKSSSLLFSDTSLFKGVDVTPPSIKKWLILSTLLLSLFTLLNPRLLTPLGSHGVKVPQEGRALYFVLDRSGSMKKNVTLFNKTGWRQESQFNLLKGWTRVFIEHDLKNEQDPNGDLIGLVTFARVPQVITPLTLDTKQVLHSLENLTVVSDQSQDGTAIGYAIYKTAHLIQITKENASKEGAGYKIKGSAIILITDGVETIVPDDANDPYRSMSLVDAAEYAKGANIKLYLVNIFEELDKERYAPQKRLMQKAAEITGGAFFSSTDPLAVPEIYQKISELEKSSLPLPSKGWQEIYVLYPYLIAITLALLVTSLAIDRWFYVEVP